MALPIRTRGFVAALAVAALVTNGCRTVDYVPREIPIADEVAAFSNHPEISLRNAAPAGTVLIAKMGALTLNGDLHEWTRIAVELATSELGKRGVQVADGGGKSVELSITSVKVIRGFAAMRCILVLHAVTGGGAAIDVEGNNASPATLYRAIDGAVTRAVTSLLAHEAFRAYLAGS